MDREIYGVLCESDVGLDAFGNALGEQILMESTGALSKSEAMDRASILQSTGRYGRVKLVRIVILNYTIT